MAVTHGQTIRNGFAGNVLTALDGGAGNAKCNLKVGVAIASSLTLNKPSFAQTAQDLDLIVAPAVEQVGAPGNASPVDNMEFVDSNDTVIFAGDNVTLIGNGGDIELSNLTINNGDTVQFTSFKYTASP